MSVSPRIAAAIESHDLQCALHRWLINQDPGEIASLTTPQLQTAIRLIGADPTWPIWQYLERRLNSQGISSGKLHS